MSLLQLKEVIFNHYRELICTIPSSHLANWDNRRPWLSAYTIQRERMVKEQLNMLKEFKSSFISGYEGDNGEKEYDVTVQDCLHQLPILKKWQVENGAAVIGGISVCGYSFDD
jgi:hypothetical protein